MIMVRKKERVAFIEKSTLKANVIAAAVIFDFDLANSLVRFH